MRLKVIPTLRRSARAHFPFRSSAGQYEQLQRDLDWDEGESGPCYMLSMDQDRRHTFEDFEFFRIQKQHHGKKGRKRDRRDVEYGQGENINFRREQLIPTAPKVPDTIQQPVELCIGKINSYVHNWLKDLNTVTFKDLQEATEAACVVENNGLDGAEIRKYWEHACSSIAVFAALRDSPVKVHTHGQLRVFHGTQGGWVQKMLRA